MAKKMEGMQQLLVDELQDLYDAEKQLVRALPKMAKSASNEELESAFRQHLEVTRGQVQRLEKIFESMDLRAKSKPCRAMKGLVEETQEMIGEQDEEMVLDAGLIGCGRKVEHYEMAGYESARALAQQLGMREAAQLLQETMREEMEADRTLAQVSKRIFKENASAMKMQARDRQQGGASQSSRGSSSSKRTSSKSSSQSRSGAASAKRNPRGSQRHAGGSAHPITDHEEIRQWAEERGGAPSCVRGTGDRGDIGMLRLDFPGYTGADSLQSISWDDWFEKFDERGLALLVQDRTGRGQKSNFNKLVSRETAAQRSRPKTHSAH
jgi:ferritin-like metal-binding protein YciE